MKEFWQSFFITVALALIWHSIGRAHTVEVIKSEPAAGAVLSESPKEVRVWFNEELQTQGSTLQVFDSQGEQVDQGDGGVDLNDPEHASMVVSLPSLPEGAYTVRWHAVLLDGDAGDGEFAFYVGAAAATAAAALSPGEAIPATNPTQTSTATFPALWLAVGGAGLLVMAIGFFLLTRGDRSSRG